MDRPDWHADAACRDHDPSVFFDGPFDYARTICEGCQVRQTCLGYALADPAILGLWAGTTERQRRRLRKRLRLAG